MKNEQSDQLFVASETLRDVQGGLAALLARVEKALVEIASVKAVSPQSVDFEESSDVLDYRKDRKPTNGLSQRGRVVMEAMIRAGISSKQIGERMGVTPSGVGYFRREFLGIKKHN